MHRAVRRVSALLLCLCLFVLLTFSAEAETDTLPVYIDGLLSDRACVQGDLVLLSPAVLSELAGCSYETETGENAWQLRFPSLTVVWEPGKEYMTAGSRYLYCPGGCQILGEEFCLPLETVAHLFSVQVERTEESISIDTLGLRLMTAGEENYYETHFKSEDLFWLARIIDAEAGGEPLAGMIGVGNVILNRVADPHFPTSVMDVVFDCDYNVQFHAAAEGDTQEDPNDQSELAARLCLEGFRTVGDSLYFVNPFVGDTLWFEYSLRFVCKIGHHNFYTIP